MLKHLLWFIVSVIFSAIIIASVDWIHSYFVTLLTKPIEKNIAENMARDYNQLMMHSVAPSPPVLESTVDTTPAPVHAIPAIPADLQPQNNDIYDYVANMNHTYTPDQYKEMKNELKDFMQSAYNNDTTDIVNL